MICSKCGRTIADGAKFCAYCGAPQSGASGGPYRSGGNGSPRGGDAFGSPRGGGDAFGSRRGGDAFDSRRGGDAFGSPRGGDAFGSRRGGDAFGSPRRGGASRPGGQPGSAKFVLLLLGALLAIAGGVVRACMNVAWKDYLKATWQEAERALSYSKDTALYLRISGIGIILYNALPGLLMILFAVLVLTKGRRRASGTGWPAMLIPVVEFVLLNIVMIWGLILAASFGGGDVADMLLKEEFRGFILPIIMEIVFAVVYIHVTGKLSKGRNVFVWIVPIIGAAAFVYALVINLIFADKGYSVGFLIYQIEETLPLYLISFGLFFAGASVAVFGFPRGQGRMAGPGRDARAPYARGGRDSFGRY